MNQATRRTFTRKEIADRAFLRVSRLIFELWEEGRGDTRLLDKWFLPDELVLVGTSKAGSDHREHVVPRLLIYERCEQMFTEGASIDQVATFIRKYLKIVRISRSEQQRVDYELKLKTRMPEGWTFDTGDLYARLTAAAIDFEPVQDA